MALEDTLRWSTRWPGDPWPHTHTRPYRTDEPNWRWMQLWDQENPRPENPDDHDAWWAARTAMGNRIWVAYNLPQFLVWDWNEEDVTTARALMSRHACSVCGAADDSGCFHCC